MVKDNFVYRENNCGKIISEEGMVDSVDIEDLLRKKYMYILKSMQEKSYSFRVHHCTYFKELVYKKKVVGFCAYTIINQISNLSLVASYILPQFRGKGLFFDEINRVFESGNNLSIYEPSDFIVNLLMKYGFAKKIGEELIVSSISFEVAASSITDIYGSDELLYQDYFYSTNYYNSALHGSVIILKHQGKDVLYFSPGDYINDSKDPVNRTEHFENTLKTYFEKKDDINEFLEIIESNIDLNNTSNDDLAEKFISGITDAKINDDNIVNNINKPSKKKHSLNDLSSLDYEKYVLAYKDVALYDFIKKFENNNNIDLTNSIIEIDYDFKNDFLKRSVVEEDYISNTLSKREFMEYVNSLKVSELKQVLKENDLTLTGNKNDLIERILEYVSPKTVKLEEYHITDKGRKFIEKNSQIDFFNMFLKKFYYYEFNEYYTELNLPLPDVCTNFLEKHLNKSVEEEDFDAYVDTVSSLASMNEFYHDYEYALYYELKLFIMRLNPIFIDETLLNYYQPIQKGNVDNIKSILSENKMDLDEEFKNAWRLKEFDEIIIPYDKCILFLNKVLSDEDRDYLNDKIREKYLQKETVIHDKLDNSKQTTLDKYL